MSGWIQVAMQQNTAYLLWCAVKPEKMVLAFVVSKFFIVLHQMPHGIYHIQNASFISQKIRMYQISITYYYHRNNSILFGKFCYFFGILSHFYRFSKSPDPQDPLLLMCHVNAESNIYFRHLT